MCSKWQKSSTIYLPFVNKGFWRCQTCCEMVQRTAESWRRLWIDSGKKRLLSPSWSLNPVLDYHLFCSDYFPPPHLPLVLLKATIMVYQAISEYWSSAKEPEYDLNVNILLPGMSMQRYNFNRENHYATRTSKVSTDTHTNSQTVAH